MDYFSDWAEAQIGLADALLASLPFEVGEWQSQRQLKDDPMGVTYELQNCVFQYQMPRTQQEAQLALAPNLPWAEDHFRERVGGKPLNPPPSEQWWPFAQEGNAGHKDGGDGEIFSHTYPERFWPKQAGDVSRNEVVRKGASSSNYFGPGKMDRPYTDYANHRGIRYEYGDLRDVTHLLARSPKTRQAFLPVWFPEDTGNHAEVRVPCTLGYLFQYRPPGVGDRRTKGEFHVTYLIRSCDFIRHWVDDCYMAMRLAQWLIDKLAQLQESGYKQEGDQPEGHPWWRSVSPGTFTFHAMSLHAFGGDRVTLEKWAAADRAGKFSKGGVTYDLGKL